MVAIRTPRAEEHQCRTIKQKKKKKKRDVHKISARNSGAGNGCANFMGARHFCVLSAGKPPMPIKFLLLGGGGGVVDFLEGGWKCCDSCRGWHRAQKPLDPGNTKKLRNPPPRVGPRKYEKNTEKKRKW